MAWKDRSSASFTGGSGQMAVMAELLHRKCNAAVPHTAVGTDLFAFRDDREDVARIQIKTAPGKPYQSGHGYHAKFGIPMAQLARTDSPPLFYALAVRLESGWGSFIVISRAALYELWNNGCGSENKSSGDLELHIQFRPDEETAGRKEAESEQKLKALCGKSHLTVYINAWESLPPLKPPVPIDVDLQEGGDATVGGAATRAGLNADEAALKDAGPEPSQA
jgi:hypothetical protein